MILFSTLYKENIGFILERDDSVLYRNGVKHRHACVIVYVRVVMLIRDAPIPLFYKPIRVRVFLFVYLPIPILLSFGLNESAINLEADFILSSADYVKPIVQN